jgi:iron complex outermembrane recepter protein
MTKTFALPHLALGLALGLAATFPAAAQETPRTDGDDFHTQDQIIVTAPYVRSLDILGNVTVVEGDELARDLRGQIGDSLTRQAGVSATSFAPGASRPVLRGFQGERVRVLNDGIGAIDVSNTSADHGVTIDPLTIERVEILRGPAVLLFGSQAIGGAVNLFDRRIPRSVPTDHPHIDAIAGYGTAANDRNGGASLDLALTPKLALHLDGSYRKSGDVRTGGFVFAPALQFELLEQAAEELEEGNSEEADELLESAIATGRVPNSGNRTWTASGGLAFIDDGGQLGIALSHYNSRYGVPTRPGAHHHEESEGEVESASAGITSAAAGGEEEGEESVTIGMKQWRVDVRGEVELGDGFFEKLRLRGGFADYEHTEFEGDEIGTVFTNKGIEARAEFTQADRNGWRGASGLQYVSRDFNAVGAEAFVPANLTEQIALFTLQEWTLGPWGLEAAARYETTNVKAQQLGLSRSFDAFSAALGARYDFGDRSNISVSVSRAVRAPSAEELYSNGPHIATQAFEVGDPDFAKEKSWGAEASVKLRGDRFSLALTGYANWFDGFIFADDTGLEEDDLPVFLYRQKDARIYGFEAEASARIAQFAGFNLNADAVADLTRAKIKGGDFVPRIPPLRLLGGLELQGDALDLRAEVEWSDDQTRIAAFETPTEGFTLVNLSAAWRPLSDNDRLTLMLSANNIFDVSARRHASFTKDFVPLAGRDIRVSARISF